MGKLPSFQFYPGDWLRDQVAGCSWAAQGLWLRLMNIAHDAEPYGHLAINGVSIPPENLARMCGGTLTEYTAVLAELDRVGVPSYTPDGVMYSRRMVNDAQKREQNAQRQAKHRNEDTHNESRSNNSAVTHESQARDGPVTAVSLAGNSDVTAESQPSSSSVVPCLRLGEQREQDVPSSRPAAGGKPRRAPKGGESDSYPSLEEALEEAERLGLAAWKAEDWWTRMAGFGWVLNGKPVRLWRALLKHQHTLWVRDGGKVDPPSFAKKLTAHKVEPPSPLEVDIDKLLREVKALE